MNTKGKKRRPLLFPGISIYDWKPDQKTIEDAVAGADANKKLRESLNVEYHYPKREKKNG